MFSLLLLFHFDFVIFVCFIFAANFDLGSAAARSEKVLPIFLKYIAAFIFNIVVCFCCCLLLLLLLSGVHSTAHKTKCAIWIWNVFINKSTWRCERHKTSHKSLPLSQSQSTLQSDVGIVVLSAPVVVVVFIQTQQTDWTDSPLFLFLLLLLLLLLGLFVCAINKQVSQPVSIQIKII